MMRCSDNCCAIKYSTLPRKPIYKTRSKKSGVFIFDPVEKRVLLVQSRGHLWGSPKGTIEQDETNAQCAIREVKEETGLDINVTDFQRGVKIKNRALYYYAELKTTEVDPENKEENDVNGITWIKIDCLAKMIKDGNMILNQDCKLLFRKFLGIVFPLSDFIKVEKKKSRSK